MNTEELLNYGIVLASVIIAVLMIQSGAEAPECSKEKIEIDSSHNDTVFREIIQVKCVDPETNQKYVREVRPVR